MIKIPAKIVCKYTWKSQKLKKNSLKNIKHDLAWYFKAQYFSCPKKDLFNHPLTHFLHNIQSLSRVKDYIQVMNSQINWRMLTQSVLLTVTCLFVCLFHFTFLYVYYLFLVVALPIYISSFQFFFDKYFWFDKYCPSSIGMFTKSSTTSRLVWLPFLKCNERLDKHDKQTKRQTDKQKTDKQTNRQTDKQTNRQTDMTDRQTWQIDGQTNMTDRETNRRSVKLTKPTFQSFTIRENCSVK